MSLIGHEFKGHEFNWIRNKEGLSHSKKMFLFTLMKPLKNDKKKNFILIAFFILEVFIFLS